MVKQPTYSLILMNIARIVAVALLILFFLPWFSNPNKAGAIISGTSLLVELIPPLIHDEITAPELTIGFVVILGLLPINSILILLSTFYRRNDVSVISMFTGFMGLIPFVLITVLAQEDIIRWYPAAILTMLCLVTLIFVGAIMHWKPTNKTPSSAF